MSNTCTRCGFPSGADDLCKGCRSDDAAGVTVAQYAERVADMFREDAQGGTLPSWVTRIGSLDEHTDVNSYLSDARVPYFSDAEREVLNQVRDEVDRQLPPMMAEIRRAQGEALREAAEAGWDPGVYLTEDDPTLAAMIAEWCQDDATKITWNTVQTVKDMIPSAERYQNRRARTGPPPVGS
jgi:hypothetical protein